MRKQLIISDVNKKSLALKKSVINLITKNNFYKKNLAIVIGGDGFMLQTLKKNKNSQKQFYGVNSGNYGFLMNKFSQKNYSLSKCYDGLTKRASFPRLVRLTFPKFLL